MSKKSSIEVAIRIRPMRNELNEANPAWDVTKTTLREKHNPDCHFTFERVYGMNSTTLDLYEQSVKNIIVKNVPLGYNGTVFAYGQTGSGKSFTMLGTGDGGEGIVSMAIKDLFSALDAEKTGAKGKRVDIQVFVSMLEIYNEQLRDLLIAPGGVAAPLAIRENEHGVYVHNATKRLVSNAKQCLHIIQNEAESRRVSAATAMNERSSRSHCLIRVHVEKTLSFDADSDDSESDGEDAPAGVLPGAELKKKIVSSLNLVDLAGSERVWKTQATGQRVVEGGHINKSLTILTTVINRLTETGTKGALTHVPYRDSKLTHLLKTAIGGNSFTTVFCCMTIADLHVDESRSTLQFAARAKTIKNEVSMNEIADSRTKIKELEADIKRLKRTLVASDIYLWSKQLKIKILMEGGGGGETRSSPIRGAVTSSAGGDAMGNAALEQVAQLQMIVEQLTFQNEELQEEVFASRAAMEAAGMSAGGRGGSSTFHVDPSMGVADDAATRELRQRVADLEQELQETSDERDALQESLDELDEMAKELEEENSQKSQELAQLAHQTKSLENQLNAGKGLEQSLTKQLEMLRAQLNDAEQRALEHARGDDLLEALTKLHVEHQTLQFEHNTLMDMYSREEIEKAANIDLLNDRIKEMQMEKEELRAQSQMQNSYLWRLLSVAALATHGKAIDPEETKSTVREHQVDNAVKSLTAFVSSRVNRPPGVVGSDGGSVGSSRLFANSTSEDVDASGSLPASKSNNNKESSSSQSLVGDEALIKRIKELEQQLVAKDAQRDIIIDTKLKRIQELVLRLHTTNTKLSAELHTLGEQNGELFEIIKKEPKLLNKLNKTHLTPFNESDALARASYAPVPQKPFGHN